MATTIMRDSVVGDDWIRQMVSLNPVQRVLDAATGQPNGNILTGPVRLAFCDSLLEAKPQMRSDPTSKLAHSAMLLFPPITDMSIFVEEYYNVGHRDFPTFYNREQNRFFGLDEAYTDQAAKSGKYAGFTPGSMCMTVSSKFKPAIVDAQGNPIIDPNRVYAGVWAIVAVSAYASGKNAPRKGPRFGLQQIMLVGDDTKLSGGAPDPSKTFAQAKVAAPAAVPGSAFGQNGAGAPPPPPPPPGMGGHTGAYYGSTGHAPPPPPPPAGNYVPADEDLSGLM